jgi:hypothetical protein
MSYEDLEEARAKRAAIDAAKAKTKGKRGQKRKAEVAMLEPKANVVRVSAPAAQVRDLQVAPVARMI